LKQNTGANTVVEHADRAIGPGTADPNAAFNTEAAEHTEFAEKRGSAGFQYHSLDHRTCTCSPHQDFSAPSERSVTSVLSRCRRANTVVENASPVVTRATANLNPTAHAATTAQQHNAG
jgi:hypothetical protein